MAEFQEVMRQWTRMCDACDNEEDVKCFIDGNVCGRFHAMKDRMNVAAIEKTVMQWAAEHPEPVYPTFAEWMYDSFLKWCQGNYPGRAKDEKAWYDYIYETHIPADIAEKLGIEPKEGT